MEVRGIPSHTAFTGTVAGFKGLFYYAGNKARTWELLCLDVRDPHYARAGFGLCLRVNGTTVVEDYDGPLDLRVKVKGYSPKRPPGQKPSHVVVSGERAPRFDRGPRVVRIREDEEALP